MAPHRFTCINVGAVRSFYRVKLALTRGPSLRDTRFATGGIAIVVAAIASSYVTQAANPTPASHDRSEYWQAGPYCGPNALYYLLRLKGVSVDHRALLADLNPGESGSSLLELCEAARRHGVAATAVQASAARLDDVPTPFIAHLPNPTFKDHFALVLRVDDSTVALIDGTLNTVATIYRPRFTACWSGRALIAEPLNDLAAVEGWLRLVVAALTLLLAFLVADRALLLFHRFSRWTVSRQHAPGHALTNKTTSGQQ